MINHVLITLLTSYLLLSNLTFSVSDTLVFTATILADQENLIPNTDTLNTDSIISPPPVLSDPGQDQHEFSENNLPDTGLFLDTLVDSSIQDSMQRAERKLDYLENNTDNRLLYQKYPQSLDSLYNLARVLPFQIFRSDGLSLFDIFSQHQSFISVPTTISSNLNSFLFYGFPAPLPTFYPDKSLLSYYRDPSVGINLYSAAEIQELNMKNPRLILGTMQPHYLTKAETNIFMELGVFGENTANVRFARPLSRALQIGIFSHFQYFTRKDYSHKKGGMYDAYRTFYERFNLDTSFISNNGTNPLTEEQITSIYLKWQSKHNLQGDFLYKYADIHNDLSSQFFGDSTVDTTMLVWEERILFSHFLNSRFFFNPRGQKLSINGETFLQKNINRRDPVSLIIKSAQPKRGESLLFGGALASHYAINIFDTLSLHLSVDRNRTVRYSGFPGVIHHTLVNLKYRNHYQGRRERFSGALTSSIGYHWIKYNEVLESILTGEFLWSQALANQSITFFFNHNYMPVGIPFNDQFQVVLGDLIDHYQSYGGETKLQYKKLGIVLGFCLTNGIRSSSVFKLWPNGVLPYAQPQWTIKIAPFGGTWAGISFASQWFIADKKPYIKSQSLLSTHFNRPGKTLHVLLDVGFDHWSKRENMEYAGIDIWDRPIYNFHLKTTVQVKTFRLFYKIDNIFNRKNAYVPGYFMPGIIFRYGLNWLIQG